MQMKTAISLPDPIFHSAERLAARLGISRSELYRRAIETLLERHDQYESTITSQLDAVYGTRENNPGLGSRPWRAPVSGDSRRGRSVKRGEIWWASLAAPTGPDPAFAGPCWSCPTTASTAARSRPSSLP